MHIRIAGCRFFIFASFILNYSNQTDLQHYSYGSDNSIIAGKKLSIKGLYRNVSTLA